MPELDEWRPKDQELKVILRSSLLDSCFTAIWAETLFLANKDLNNGFFFFKKERQGLSSKIIKTKQQRDKPEDTIGWT